MEKTLYDRRIVDTEVINLNEARMKILDLHPELEIEVDELIRLAQKVIVRDAITALQDEFSNIIENS